nr:hypothetical protein [Tanacetum cinerariifolium]
DTLQVFLVEPYQSSFCFARNMRIPAIVLHHRCKLGAWPT